jgi:hypothetical protein
MPSITEKKALAVTGCCALTANGQAVAEATIPLMKSRRHIAFHQGQDYAEKETITAGICDRRNGVRGVKLHSSNFEPPMSALGHKRTFPHV